MKRIKDPIYGYIEIPSEYINTIVDTPFFQRLRSIRQLTATNRVYPSANHTRFEHSLGVFHLADRAFDNIDSNNDLEKESSVLKRTVHTAALLHDIGHPPLSHIGEELLDRDELIECIERTGFDKVLMEVSPFKQDPLEKEHKHELLSCYIILTEFNQGLRAMDIDPEEVCCYILGTTKSDGWQGEVASDLISSTIDVDRLDYIKRDDIMTGAEVAHIDTDRMLNSYDTVGNSLVLSDKALSAIRNFLAGRVSLYMWVNQHHKSVFANELLKRTVRSFEKDQDENPLSVERIRTECVGDAFILEKLRAWSNNNKDSRTAELYSMFRNREFYTSCWKHPLEFEECLGDDATAFHKLVSLNRNDVERRLQEIFDDKDIWIVNPKIPDYSVADLRSIHLGHDDEKRSVQSLGLYQNPSFIRDTPYVYTRDVPKDEIVETIKSEV